MLTQDTVMKKSEGGIRESIKRAFAALAYEHSNEMLSLSEKSRLLSGRAKGADASKENYPKLFNKTTDPK